MQASTFQIIAIICFVLALISFLITIYFFIHYDIKKVYNFLTGKTALNEIKQISEESNTHKKNNFTIIKDKDKTKEITNDFDKNLISENTMILAGNETTVLDNSIDEEINFVLEDEIIVIHTNKIIGEVA